MTVTETRAVPRQSVMSIVFVLFVGGGILFGAVSGRMKEVTDASLQAAKESVHLAIGLIGVMALWLGLMKVLEAGGFLFVLARWVRPAMRRLFPEVPEDHPAMGAMIMNISANMLGLGNAATPFGIRAMGELNRLNPFPGTATNAMCLFLAINTSSVTILPLGVIAVRAAAGSSAPAAIFLPTLLATIFSTVTGILVAMWLAHRDRAYREEIAGREVAGAKSSIPEEEVREESPFRLQPGGVERVAGYALLAGFGLFMAIAAIRAESVLHFVRDQVFSYWLLPGLMVAILAYGLIRGVKIYEAVTDGAKQGFDTAVRIIPFLVAILVAVALIRQSGAMDLFAAAIGPVTDLIGMPPEAVPMALVRPLSGTGAFGIMSAIVAKDPDSYPAFVASVMNGSCDTTFYILAVYFGSVGIVRYRHAVAAGLAADVVGLCSSAMLSRVFWVEG